MVNSNIKQTPSLKWESNYTFTMLCATVLRVSETELKADVYDIQEEFAVKYRKKRLMVCGGEGEEVLGSEAGCSQAAPVLSGDK